MSSHAQLSVSVIISNGLVSPQMSRELFISCLHDLDGELKGNDVFMKGIPLGTVSFSKRVVLEANPVVFANTKKEREELRKLITKRSLIAQENYINNLLIEKERLENSSKVFQELSDQVETLNSEIRQSEIAKKRQVLDECHAFEQELCEEAENQGFDVITENTENGIQLQFIKREY